MLCSNSHNWLVGMQTGITTLKNYLVVPSKAEHLHILFHSYTYTEEKCKHMFIKRHVLEWS